MHNKLYNIQLMLTKKCNQSCHYCSTYSVLDDTIVDIDYIKWILDQCPDNLGIELTGGEIGLINNIDDVYRTVRDHPNVEHITALSNGLLRIKGVDWIKEIEYWEHLIYEIKGKEIIKFYSNLDLEQDHTYVIVTTPTTTRSLLANWNHYKKVGLFRDNFFYKIMNHKSLNFPTSIYIDDLTKLYKKLGNKYKGSLLMIMHWHMKSFLKKQKKLCQKYSPNPYIDVQEKLIGHCAINVNKSTKVKFSKENVIKLINGEFSDNSYCADCYSFDFGKNRSANKNRSYET